jgi:hypothetical protein
MGSHVMDGESASFGKEVGQDATNNVTVAYCTSVSPPLLRRSADLPGDGLCLAARIFLRSPS